MIVVGAGQREVRLSISAVVAVGRASFPVIRADPTLRRCSSPIRTLKRSKGAEPDTKSRGGSAPPLSAPPTRDCRDMGAGRRVRKKIIATVQGSTVECGTGPGSPVHPPTHRDRPIIQYSMRAVTRASRVLGEAHDALANELDRPLAAIADGPAFAGRTMVTRPRFAGRRTVQPRRSASPACIRANLLKP